MAFSKTTEHVPDVLPDAQPVQLPQVATLVPIPEEIQITTAHVLLVSTMLELTNVPLAAQAVPLVQAPPLVPLVMPEDSESSTILFVSVKMDTSNLSSKMEPESAPNAHQNAELALKVPLNAQVVMPMLTELKVTTPWATEHVSAGLVTTLLPMEDVFNPTANQTNGVHNVRLISLFVSNVKPT